MIESKIEYGCEGLAECDQGAEGSDYSTCDHVVPVVVYRTYVKMIDDEMNVSGIK